MLADWARAACGYRDAFCKKNPISRQVKETKTRSKTTLEKLNVFTSWEQSHNIPAMWNHIDAIQTRGHTSYPTGWEWRWADRANFLTSCAKRCHNINASCALFCRRGKFPRRHSVCDRWANRFGRVPDARAIIHLLRPLAPRAAHHLLGKEPCYIGAQHPNQNHLVNYIAERIAKK